MPEMKRKKPQAETKSGSPPKPAQVAAVSQPIRPITYPKFEVFVAAGESALTAAQAKELLNWEGEAAYAERMRAEDPQVRELGLKPEFGENYTLKDENGEKVTCWNSARNRPFRESWAKQLAQDILNRNWAGSLSMPGLEEFTYGGDAEIVLDDGTVVPSGGKIKLPIGTPNGEAVIIGRTGDVLSANHRLVALVLAGQKWAKDDHWKSLWPTEPVLETVIVLGVSESPRVLQTLDNVMPRSEADVIYTSDVFADLRAAGKVAEVKECSRMLAKAIDLLWKRTGAGKNEHHGYQSHSESMSFRERHPRLLECIRFILALNPARPGSVPARAISVLKLSPGQCSALLYLFGASASSAAKYRDADLPSEKSLDWEHWGKAQEFFTALAKDAPEFKPVRAALANLVDAKDTLGGRAIEKGAVLCRAWNRFVAGAKITPKDVELEYSRTEEGVLKLESWPTVGGIDIGEEPEGSADKETETPEEIEKRKAAERRRAAEEAAAKIAARRESGKYQNGKKGIDVVADALVKDSKVPAKPAAVAAAKPAATKPSPNSGKPAGKPGTKLSTTASAKPPAKPAPRPAGKK